MYKLVDYHLPFQEEYQRNVKKDECLNIEEIPAMMLSVQMGVTLANVGLKRGCGKC